MQRTLNPRTLMIRKVKIDDIPDVYKLLAANRPYVGLNSCYTYYLLARDFNDTCLVALDNNHVIAFASGYVPPTRSDTFFSWEVVVDKDYRGHGLQKTLLLEQLRMTGAKYFEGTVNPSNHVSEKNFLEVAKILGAECTTSILFSEGDFGYDGHEAEVLFRIGPISLDQLKQSCLQVKPYFPCVDDADMLERRII
jgi:L-2,4-diaminobutyric acid acetyltransferase